MRTRTVIGASLLAIGVGVVGLAVVASLIVFRGRPAASDDEVVGSWRGADGAALTVREDHTLAAVDVPFQLPYPDLFTGPWTGEGTWELVGPGKGSAQHLNLTLDQKLLPIYVRKKGDEVQLYLYDGPSAQGKRYWLTRL